MAGERILGSIQKLAGYELIETRDHYPELEPLPYQLAYITLSQDSPPQSF
jgi:hypothetical protein